MYLCHICAVESVNVGVHVKEQVAVGGNIGDYYDQRYADCLDDGELTQLQPSSWRRLWFEDGGQAAVE